MALERPAIPVGSGLYFMPGHRHAAQLWPRGILLPANDVVRTAYIADSRHTMSVGGRNLL